MIKVRRIGEITERIKGGFAYGSTGHTDHEEYVDR